MGYEITEKDVPPQLSLTRRVTVTMDTIGQGLNSATRTLTQHAAATGAETVGPPMVFSPDFGKEEFDLVICMPVAVGAVAGEGVALEEVPGAHVLSTTHKGPYLGVPEAYRALFAWLEENDREAAGPAREVYLNDPHDVPESELLVEVSIPLA
jgi:effector-binding domain-containing protein